MPRRPLGKKAWYCFGAAPKTEVPLLDDSVNSAVGEDLEKESPEKMKEKVMVEPEKVKEKVVDGAGADKEIRV